jgi:hypothetical protein
MPYTYYESMIGSTLRGAIRVMGEFGNKQAELHIKRHLDDYEGEPFRWLF